MTCVELYSSYLGVIRFSNLITPRWELCSLFPTHLQVCQYVLYLIIFPWNFLKMILNKLRLSCAKLSPRLRILALL